MKRTVHINLWYRLESAMVLMAVVNFYVFPAARNILTAQEAELALIYQRMEPCPPIDLLSIRLHQD